MMRWNDPRARSRSDETASRCRSKLFGVITTSGLRHGRKTCRRSRWKIHAGLAQRRVEDVEAALSLAEVGERCVPFAVARVGEHCVAVAEGPTPRVLAGEADGSPVVEQRGEREVLPHAPVERLAAVALGELAPALEQLRHLVVRRKPLGNL